MHEQSDAKAGAMPHIQRRKNSHGHQPLAFKVTRAIKLVELSLGLLETEGAKTLIVLAVFVCGAVFSIQRIEAGTVVLSAALFVLGVRLRPQRSGAGMQMLVSALLTLLGKASKPPT